MFPIAFRAIGDKELIAHDLAKILTVSIINIVAVKVSDVMTIVRA